MNLKHFITYVITSLIIYLLLYCGGAFIVIHYNIINLPDAYGIGFLFGLIWGVMLIILSDD